MADVVEKSKISGKVLVTAGPVWVPIDRVRVMTNRFTGKTGLDIALRAARRGFGVTLLLGPGQVEIPKDLPANLDIARFHYYEELYALMEKNIRSGDYRAVIHTAAVPDYVPREVIDGKIKSGQNDLTIAFKPTAKIVDMVKAWDKDIILVKFKLEVGLSKEELLSAARASMSQSNADLIVANDLSDYEKHIAYIMDKEGKLVECVGNEAIASNLSNLI